MAQKYIPGLTARPTEDSQKDTSKVAAPKEVPQELIDDFKNGTKQVRQSILLM